MINKIIKIKNLGIFNDYSANTNLPDFKKFNLIYGWNGTGKTTFSELFTAFNSGTLQEHKCLKYQFKSNEQVYSENKAYEKNIRVFNQNYITENIDIIEGKAKSIVIIGKENKDLIKAIQRDEKILNGDPNKKDDLGKIKELSLKEQELERKEKEKGKKFTDVARIISANTSGVSARNYNKNNAENAFSGLASKAILTEKEIQQYSTTLQQQQKDHFTPIKTDATKGIEQIILDSTSILKRTVETIVIDRLKKHPSISQWVEKGIDLHKDNKSTFCEFCNQPLPENRIPDLLSYFNDADKKLKSDIDNLLDRVRALYSLVDQLYILDKANLYDEFQEGYTSVIKEIAKHKNTLLLAIEGLGEIIKDKKQHTTEQLSLTTSLDATSFNGSITDANSFIINCNTKTNGFSQEKTLAESKLENHYLSEISDDISQLTITIDTLKIEAEYLGNGNPNTDEDGIVNIQNRIRENKNKISTSGTACVEINNQLATFLGRDELFFEVVEEGYEIKRKGNTAKNLSEGEKTAIAFVYFTIHLTDQDFDIEDGIVVIDDPISSLDSNSIFQAFSFLKNTVKEVQQVFILTHNFNFLQLLIGWLRHSNTAEYYMVKNNNDSNSNRVATLDSLDKLLIEYSTEYQYLFKILYTFKSDGTIAYVYHIPNIARKALEYFLAIMVPNNASPFKKMEKIDFDEHKKTAIYKFTNDQSHMTGDGFNPSLVPECQNNVKYLLEMIEAVFPEHYNILQESSQ